MPIHLAAENAGNATDSLRVRKAQDAVAHTFSCRHRLSSRGLAHTPRFERRVRTEESQVHLMVSESRKSLPRQFTRWLFA